MTLTCATMTRNDIRQCSTGKVPFNARAVSIRQPYAALIAHGIKRIENRSWSIASGFYLIHASKTHDDDAFAEARERVGTASFDFENLTRGAIVGAMRVADCVAFDDVRDDPWAIPGSICWVIDWSTVFEYPIPCPGSLGVFSPWVDAEKRARPFPSAP